MESHGWIILGAVVAAIGLMFWFLPGYGPEGVTYGAIFTNIGVATTGLGVGLALRGAWKRAA